MFFSKFFKKKYPYAPIAYLGRKTVERTLDANIRKLKKVEKEIGEEQDHTNAEASKAEKKNAESNKALNKKVDAKKSQKKAVDQSKKSVEKSKSKVSTKSKK